MQFDIGLPLNLYFENLWIRNDIIFTNHDSTAEHTRPALTIVSQLWYFLNQFYEDYEFLPLNFSCHLLDIFSIGVPPSPGVTQIRPRFSRRGLFHPPLLRFTLDQHWPLCLNYGIFSINFMKIMSSFSWISRVTYWISFL